MVRTSQKSGMIAMERSCRGCRAGMIGVAEIGQE
jgi:hypothetical protein